MTNKTTYQRLVYCTALHIKLFLSPTEGGILLLSAENIKKLFCAIFNPVQSTFLVLHHVLSLTCFSLFSLIRAPSHSDSCWLLLCQRVSQSCWFGCGPLLFFRRLNSSFKHKHLHCSFLPSWLSLIHSGFVILTLLKLYAAN